MTQDRVIANDAAFNFNTYQVTATTNLPTTLTYSALSTGDVIGSSGFRLWDVNTLAEAGTVALTAAAPWVAPLTGASLPPKLFDAVIDLTIDGQSLPLAFSTSPDNFSAYDGDTTLTNGNLYWVNLMRWGLYSAPTSAQETTLNLSRDYHFGGEPYQYSPALPNLAPVKLNLQQPLTAATNFTYKIDFVPRLNDLPQSVTATVNIAPSLITRDIVIGYWPTNLPLGSNGGYFKITVTCEDLTFRSLLPVYHWGISPAAAQA